MLLFSRLRDLSSLTHGSSLITLWFNLDRWTKGNESRVPEESVMPFSAMKGGGPSFSEALS